MSREPSKPRLISRRALALGGGKLALIGVLAGRLYYLQVLEAGRYTMLSDKNRISIRILAPPRGHILDRFGVEMATNAPTYRVEVVAEQAGNVSATLDALAKLIPITDSERRRVMREVRRKHKFVPVVVCDKLSWNEMARIELNTFQLPGVSSAQGLTRTYPFGKTASHLVGYVAAVGENDLTGDDPLLELPDFRVGRNGIEKAYDLELRGVAGTSQLEVNAVGRVVRELARKAGTPGHNVVLGVDMALQDAAERACAAQGSASCVVMDAWTGEVLALVSTPSYDPTAFSAGLSSAEWKDLVTDPQRPLSNKSISGIYAPGSTFKPLMAVAGLEDGVISADTEFFCPGTFHLGDTVFHCWKKGGHGHLSVRRAIKESCDVFFYNLANLLGIDRMAAMARRFGLGETLGIEIPGERAGLIPTTAWKKATTGVSWQRGETISCGIGQSYISVTPLQLCTYAARLVTGVEVRPRLVRPHGVMKAGDPAEKAPAAGFTPLALDRDHIDLVLNGMYGVVNEQGGTAYHARIEDPSMLMGGKTGTAQVHHISAAEREHGHLTGISVPWKYRDHALFIAFAPFDNPRYVCSVVVEHGGLIGGEGGAVAAPIARDVLIEAQKRDPARKTPDRPFMAEVAVAGS